MMMMMMMMHMCQISYIKIEVLEGCLQEFGHTDEEWVALEFALEDAKPHIQTGVDRVARKVCKSAKLEVMTEHIKEVLDSWQLRAGSEEMSDVMKQLKQEERKEVVQKIIQSSAAQEVHRQIKPTYHKQSGTLYITQTMKQYFGPTLGCPVCAGNTQKRRSAHVPQCYARFKLLIKSNARKSNKQKKIMKTSDGKRIQLSGHQKRMKKIQKQKKANQPQGRHENKRRKLGEPAAEGGTNTAALGSPTVTPNAKAARPCNGSEPKKPQRKRRRVQA